MQYSVPRWKKIFINEPICSDIFMLNVYSIANQLKVSKVLHNYFIYQYYFVVCIICHFDIVVDKLPQE